MRAIAQGRLDDLLQVGTIKGHEDLAAWREAKGLAPQPAICIASGSLDFPVPESVRRHGQRVFVATGRSADAARVRRLEREGYEVVIAGGGLGGRRQAIGQRARAKGLQERVSAQPARACWRPMLRDGVLSRLYLTLVHRLLGGEHFHSLIEGPEMHAAGRLKLAALYLDSTSPNDTGQFFAQFEPLR